jgi:hypothetical protein
MSKKTNSLMNSVTTEFSWSKDSLFNPPKNRQVDATNKVIEPATPQVGEFKPVVEKLLETLIGNVKAAFGIARILPIHGQTHQIISTVGLPPALLSDESDLDLNCEICGKAAIQNRIYSADISKCKSQDECRYRGIA